MQVANMAHQIAYQTVPPAPGAGAETQPGSAADPGAPPAQSPGSPGGFWFMPLMLAVMVIFLFWSGRSQKKKQEDAVKSLKKGDRLATQSGLIGRLVETGTRTAKIEIAPGVKVEVLKSSILGRDTEEAPAK